MDSQAPISVPLCRLPHSAAWPLPRYETTGSAGMDLRAALVTDLTIAPGERMRIPTGLLLALPAGCEGQVRPRSGLAIKTGLTVLNAPGTIDSDYRGEVQVLLINLGQEPVVLHPGDRIAQLVIAPTLRVKWNEVTELPQTDRGAGGFGHTGT